jgi:large subunit ribosomal protein L35
LVRVCGGRFLFTLPFGGKRFAFDLDKGTTYPHKKGFWMPRNASKPKRKLKTHRGAAKRFKVTATGKILRMHSGKRHLLGTKAPGRMRKLKKLTQVNKADVASVRQMLPYA